MTLISSVVSQPDTEFTDVVERGPEAENALISSVVSQPDTEFTDIVERGPEAENKENVNPPHDGGLLLAGNPGDNLQGCQVEVGTDDLEKIREENAATVAQAAFRGYLVFFRTC